MLFASPSDVADTWGKLHFGVTPVRPIREIEPPPFTAVGCFPRAAGVWEVFGQQLTQVGRGKESYEETNAWKPIRATTRDGVAFANPETMLDPPPGAWTQHAGMMRCATGAS